MNIDVNVISIVSNCIISIATVILTIIAWRGLYTWKKDNRWKVRIELFKELCSSAKVITETIKYVRFHISISTESDVYETTINEPAAVISKKTERAIKHKRLNAAIEEIPKLNSAAMQVILVLDDKDEIVVYDYVALIHKTVAKIKVDIDEYYDIELREARTGKRYENREYHDSLAKSIDSSCDNEIDRDIETATYNLIRRLKQLL